MSVIQLKIYHGNGRKTTTYIAISFPAHQNSRLKHPFYTCCHSFNNLLKFTSGYLMFKSQPVKEISLKVMISSLEIEKIFNLLLITKPPKSARDYQRKSKADKLVSKPLYSGL